MPPRLVEVVRAADPAVRDRPFDAACAGLSLDGLLEEAEALDAFRRTAENLYERVRALFFLHALHRYQLPARLAESGGGGRARIPVEGVRHLLARRFDAALDAFLEAHRKDGPADAVSSGLAAAYRGLGFQTLADQVRRSVRSFEGNRWMFEVRRAAEHPLRVVPALLVAGSAGRPVLRESAPVRMDLTHSAWSDIFFLGMDRPEAAKVLNVSIDLAVRGRDPEPRPPVEASVRVIDAPVLALESVDLGARAEITDLAKVFDFARDHLGLLKAAVIAAGLVPPGLEGGDAGLAELLGVLVGPGRGIEVRSCVRGIPRGSRLAVSTSLLAALIAVCMRATGQTTALEGPLREEERRLVAARAILGEWLGGSGGGWQDSGGMWPSIKLIEGATARPGDPEHGVSRGRLLPTHTPLGAAAASPEALRALCDSLVLVHGGMAQDVGPVLEMVTERYLLRSEPEWGARRGALDILERILAALRAGDVRAIGAATTENFLGPIRTIVPWATNLYTERLIEAVRARFGAGAWGFWMLGGTSGGGMGFLFDPRAAAEARDALGGLMLEVKRDLEHALPFAMDPVVYDLAIDEVGTRAELVGDEGPGPEEAPPAAEVGAGGEANDLDALLERFGFDRGEHERVRADLRAGRIGLSRNRMPADVLLEDARPEDAVEAAELLAGASGMRKAERGREALAAGEVAVVTLAGGSGTRWTGGSGVVKALHPVCRLGGAHRSFLEVHLAQGRRVAAECGTELPHVVTTSHLTHAPLERFAARLGAGGGAPLRLSPGRAVGLRLVPMERDLRFAWEETPRQLLDERAQRVRASLQAALIRWARDAGEGADYRDNEPLQCVHPVGHAYEVPNLLVNGTLGRLLEERPGLRTLLLRNVDALGADCDPGLLGLHLEQVDAGAALTFEVVPRRLEDRGGGLARVDGRPRLVESLALPHEEDELRLTLYSSMTTWIDVDRFLAALGLTRSGLGDPPRVAAAARRLLDRLPAYVTLKDVKKRWGHAQEDVFPVAQFERLWGDVTALPELACGFVVVDRDRGQQLKEPAQLDGWLRDGSAARVDSRCLWERAADSRARSGGRRAGPGTRGRGSTPRPR